MKASGVLSKCSLITAALCSLSNAAVILPSPSGTYHVDLTTSELVDYSRIDPFDPAHGHRKLMISIFYPIPLSSRSHVYQAPYVPPLTAEFEDVALAQFGIPNGTISSLRLQLHHQSSSHSRSSQYNYPSWPRPQNSTSPVILFSTAFGTTRLFYSVLAQTIASAGYTVVTLDHPYDADIVEFTSSSEPPIYAGIDTDNATQLELAVATRAEDATFVLDQLSNGTFVHSLGLNMPLSFRDENEGGGSDVPKVGMLGHSLGGAATAVAMASDVRIACGANLDGSFFGRVTSTGLDRPFLLFGQQSKATTPDPTWEAIWPKLRGWKLQLGLQGARHYTFSDLPFLVDRVGLGDKLPDEVFQGYLGTLEGRRAMEVIGTYAISFFDMVLRGKKSVLLEKESEEFPEVGFVKESL